MTQVTVTEILARWPYLSRVGQEWQGPCPNCGGRDRFHLRTRGDGSALFGCRGCIDDQPTDQKREAFKLIMTRLDLYNGTHGSLKKAPSTWPGKDNPDRNAKKNEKILAWVARVWSKGLLFSFELATRLKLRLLLYSYALLLNIVYTLCPHT